MDKYRVLKDYFGHAAFRDGQEELIDAVMSGHDVFGIMPTGGGKSICYQLPALMEDGTAIVISPLISLMKDQVMSLKTAGIPAAYVNSSLTGDEMKKIYRGIVGCEYKIIYVAPERLDADGFVSLVSKVKISLIAVDEAHCISQWGQDFRPSYLRIVNFIEKLPIRPPIAAFTATATARVREDVSSILQLHSPVLVTTGFDRPNLNFEVIRPKNRMNTLQELIQKRRGKSGIIYCSTRNNVEKVCEKLREAGIDAVRYHAGLTSEERKKNQEDFIYDRNSVMVATNAFGMGIDKSNVSFVIHYNMPKSLEAYYQEAGRAGRDGEKADCILLFSASDIQTAKFLIQNSGENEELTYEERVAVMARDVERLNVIIGYCKTTECLRGYILEYFGQEHSKFCGNCSSCRASYTLRDITTETQMILSCVKRIKDMLGYSVGISLVVKTLCGSADKRVLDLGLDRLSTYGLMKKVPKDAVRDMAEHLESEGYLFKNPEHGAVELTRDAGDVLFRGKKVEMIVRDIPEVSVGGSAKRKAKKGSQLQLQDDAADLFEVLRILRFELSKQEGVPAFMIFSNAVLTDMVAREPQSMDEFLEVSGVGAVKADKYGKQFLAAIEEYKADRM